MFWHSLVIVIVPTIMCLAILVVWRAEMQRNWWVFGVSFALSLVQGRPEVQAFYASYGREAEGLFAHAAPVFAALYLLFGRFQFPSVAMTWAGTYFFLLVSDASVVYFQWRVGPYDIGTLVHGIGGAGWGDGLVWLPLGGAAIAVFATYWLKRGHALPEMIGRRRYLAEMATEKLDAR